MVFTEVAAAFVAKQVLEHVAEQVLDRASSASGATIRGWLKREPQQLALQLALAAAVERFAAAHPDAHGSLFDETFLGGRAAPLLARCLTRKEDVGGEELASLWADTAIKGATGIGRRADLVGPAEDFLRHWREELGRHEVFRAVLDSRGIERTVELLETLAARQEADGQALERMRSELIRRLDDLDRRLVQAFYQDLKDDIDWNSRERVRGAAGVVGRRWVFDELRRLGDEDCGFCFIVAEAGLGKTALATAIAAEHSAAAFFFAERSGIVHPSQCLRHLCADLIQRFDLPHSRLRERAGDDAGLLSELLHEAVGRGEPVWLVIDALDEAHLEGRGARIMPLPDDLPPGAFMVITHRPGVFTAPRRPGARARYLPVRITPDHARQQEDVAEFIRRETRRPEVAEALANSRPPMAVAEFRRRLTRASEGNFMYVHYVLDHVRGRLGPPILLDELPQGLNEYYQWMWDAIAAHADRDGGDWERLYFPVIEHLAAAGEPVSAEWLADHIGLAAREVRRRALDAWQRFLHHDVAGGRSRWRIVHQSFRDFLATTQDIDIRATHERIGSHYAAPARWPDDGCYASRHLSMHLGAAQALTRLFALVDDPAWRAAQFELDPTGTAYLNDIGQAWTAAVQLDARSAEQRAPRLYLRRELLCALAVADIHRRSGIFSGPLLRRAVETGTWTLDQALSAAELLRPATERVNVLVELAAVVPRSRVGVLERDADDLGDPLAALRVRAAIAARATPDDRSRRLQAAWTAVRAMPEELDRARAIEIVAPLMEGQAETVAAVVDAELHHRSARARGLAAVLPLVPDRMRHRIADELLRLAMWLDDADKTAAIEAVVTPASASQARHALALTTSITDVRLRVRAAAAVLPRIPHVDRELAVHELVEAVEGVEDILDRGEALARVAPFLSTAERVNYGRSVLEYASGQGIIRRARLVRAWHDLLPDELASPAYGELMQAIAATKQPSLHAHALAELADVLTRPELYAATVLATALPDATERAALLARLAPHLTDDLVRQALNTTTTLRPRTRARAMATILPWLQGDERTQALEGVITEIGRSPDIVSRVEAALALADDVTPDMRPELLDTALGAVDGDAVTPTSTRAVATLVQRLAGDPWLTALELLGRVQASSRRPLLDAMCAALPPPPTELYAPLATQPDLSSNAAASLLRRAPEAAAAALLDELPLATRDALEPDLVRKVLGTPEVLDLASMSAAEIVTRLPTLPAERLAEAAAIVIGRADRYGPHTARALSSLAHRAPEFEFASIADLLASGPPMSVEAALIVARHLPAERAEPIVRAALADKRLGRLRMPWLRATAQRGGVPRWLTEAFLDHATTPVDRASILAAVGEAVPTELADEVFRSFGGSPKDWELLAGIAPSLSEELRDAAFDAMLLVLASTELPARASMRTRVLARSDVDLATAVEQIARRLTPAQLDRALHKIERLTSADARLVALEALIAGVPSGLAPRVVAAALDLGPVDVELARRIRHRMPPMAFTMLLADRDDIADHHALLAFADRSVADDIFMRIAVSEPSPARSAAIVALSRWLSLERLPQALDLLEGDAVAAAVERVAPRVPEERLDDLLRRIETAGPSPRHASALSRLVPTLPIGLVRRAIRLAGSLESDESRAEVLVALGSNPNAELSAEALAIAATIADPLARARALVALSGSGRRQSASLHLACADTVREAATHGDGALVDCLEELAPLLAGAEPPSDQELG